jgi:hypothetical protein
VITVLVHTDASPGVLQSRRSAGRNLRLL